MSVFLCPHCGLSLRDDGRQVVSCPSCKNTIDRGENYFALPRTRPDNPYAEGDMLEGIVPARLSDNPMLSSDEKCAKALQAAAGLDGSVGMIAPYLAALKQVNCMQSKRFRTLAELLEKHTAKLSRAEDAALLVQYITLSDLADYDRCELYIQVVEKDCEKFSSYPATLNLITYLANLPLIGIEDVKKRLIFHVVTRLLPERGEGQYESCLRLLVGIRDSELYSFDDEGKAALIKHVLENEVGGVENYRDCKLLFEFVLSLRLPRKATAALSEMVLNRYLPENMTFEAYADLAQYVSDNAKRFKYLFNVFLSAKSDILQKREFVYGMFAENKLNADDLLLYFDAAISGCKKRQDTKGRFFAEEERERMLGGILYSHEISQALPEEMKYLSELTGDSRRHTEHTPENCPDDERKRSVKKLERRGTNAKKQRVSALGVVCGLLFVLTAVQVILLIAVPQQMLVTLGRGTLVAVCVVLCMADVIFGLIYCGVRKRWGRAFIVVIEVIILIAFTSLAQSPAMAKVVEIRSASDFDKMEKYPNGEFRLMDDVTIEGGARAQVFTGTLDGNGYTVTLKAESPLVDENKGTVKNLTVKDPASEYGAFCRINSGTIQNCSVTGQSELRSGLGSAPVCEMNIGSIFNVTVNLSSSYSSFEAGFVSRNYGEIAGCSTYAKAVTGGFVSENRAMIRQCSAAGLVESGQCIGGFAGVNSGTIRDCFSTSDVAGQAVVGGFVGRIEPGEQGLSAIINCFSSGGIRQGSTAGLFAGQVYNAHDVTVINCFTVSWSPDAEREAFGDIQSYVGAHFNLDCESYDLEDTTDAEKLQSDEFYRGMSWDPSVWFYEDLMLRKLPYLREFRQEQ